MNRQSPAFSLSSPSAARRHVVACCGLVLISLLWLPGCRCSEPPRPTPSPTSQSPKPQATQPARSDLPSPATAAKLPAEVTVAAATKAVDAPKAATWTFAVSRPVAALAVPLSLRDLPPYVDLARSAVRRAMPWASGEWGAGPIALANPSDTSKGAPKRKHYVVARSIAGGLELQLAAQSLTVRWVRGECTVRSAAAAAASNELITSCNATLATWMLSHAAVWATGQLSPRDRILRFSGFTEQPPRGSRGMSSTVQVELISAHSGLRWTLVFRDGALSLLEVPSERGFIHVSLQQGGWQWRLQNGLPADDDPNKRVDRRVKAPAVSISASPLSDEVAATPPGLPVRTVDFKGRALEEAFQRAGAAIRRAGLITLGAEQLVGRWDGARFTPRQLRSPIWGATMSNATRSALPKQGFRILGTDPDFAPALRASAVPAGLYALQIGEKALGKAGHAVWVRATK